MGKAVRMRWKRCLKAGRIKWRCPMKRAKTRCRMTMSEYKLVVQRKVLITNWYFYIKLRRERVVTNLRCRCTPSSE
jgi:hypothetical protein